jgi:hypothetical protein
MVAFIFAVSIGTAAAQPRGRLIIMRSPSLGRNLVLNLQIDGRTAANLGWGSRFDRSVWTGRRILTVSAVTNGFHFPWTPNSSRPTSTVLNVRRARTYVFTAVWQGTNRVILAPGRRS